MKRPTIPDLAEASGVSVSTVNRVLNQPESVRQPTRERVLAAAQEIGFYGLGTIEHSVRAGRDTHKLGILLQQHGRTFYSILGDALRREAAALGDARVELTLTYMDDLSPEKVAEQLEKMGETCESVALVAAQHPLLADAIDRVTARGVPVTLERKDGGAFREVGSGETDDDGRITDLMEPGALEPGRELGQRPAHQQPRRGLCGAFDGQGAGHLAHREPVRCATWCRHAMGGGH